MGAEVEAGGRARATRSRRRYDSPVRRRQVAERRARVVEAGAAIAREHPIWDWRALTVRAVARRAGVSERTVYRHFENERTLRDAVMHHLELESGVELDAMTLDDVHELAHRLLSYVRSFPLGARTPQDATLLAAGDRKRRAVLDAVERASESWEPGQQRIAAAVIDAMWSVGTHERLVGEWGLEPDDAATAAIWAIDLVRAAITDDHRPPPVRTTREEQR